MPLVPADDKSSLHDEHNRIVYRDAGNSDYPAQVVWKAPSTQTAYILDADNAQGNHANFGSGILLVQDSGVTFGAVGLFPDGAVGTPSLAFSADADTGLYRVTSSTGRIGVTCDGTKVLEIVNNGGTFGLGIGLSPSVPLDVQRSSTDWVARIDQTHAAGGGKGLYVKSAESSTTSTVFEVDGNSVPLVVVQASGLVAIGDTSNANMTVGLTINQGAADDAILVLKSSDVSSPFTSSFENDTYASAQKFNANNGGLAISGIADTGSTGLRLAGFAITDDTTRATTAVGYVMADAFKSDGGTSVTSVGANGNLFVVRNTTAAKFLVDAEGDIHMDATSNINAWDDHDDVALLEAFRLTTAPGVVASYRQRFSQDVDAHAQILAETGVLTLNPDGHHFVSMKGLMGLMIDAIRQVNGRVQTVERRLPALPESN